MSFGYDTRPDKRRESFRCHELDVAAKPSFKQLGEGEKPIIGLGAGREAHEEIDITISLRGAAQHRAEERQTFHS